MYNKKEITYKIKLFINYLRHELNLNAYTKKDDDGYRQ